MPPGPTEQPRPPVLPSPDARPAGKIEPVQARLDTQEAIGGVARRRGLKNWVAGKRHEDIVGWWLEQVYGAENVAAQVHIRAYDEAGKAWTHNKVVVDYVVRDPSTGKLLYWDGKTTPNALKFGQERVYGLLEKHGGEVRSAERMPDWLKVGQDVEPGKVTFAYKSHPEEIRKLKDALQGTLNRGTSEPSRLIQSKAVGGKGVEMTATATGEPAVGTGPTSKGASAAEKASEETERIVPKANQAARLRSVARLAMRGGRIVKIAGKITFGILRAFNPVLNLLLVKDGIDLLLSWAYRERIAERDEWRRIANFLSAPAVADQLPPFGISYVTGLGDVITAWVGEALAGTRGNRDHFLTWMEKWNTDELWSGFVYATVAIALERQRLLQAGDDPHEYTYYLLGPYRPPTLSDTPPPNSKTEGGPLNVGEADARNRRTGGRGGPFNAVEMARLEVIYTFPTPVLTPFDFIIARCNELISEMILFLSKYDHDVAGLPPFVEVVSGVDINLLESYDFSKTPINGRAFLTCLDMIRKASHSLSEHAPRFGDSRHQYSQTATVGYARRLAILRDLYNPTKTRHYFLHISSMLGTLVPYPKMARLAEPVDPDLVDLTDKYLSEFAETIHKDLKRAYDACVAETTKQEYAYQGRPLPPKPVQRR